MNHEWESRFWDLLPAAQEHFARAICVFAIDKHRYCLAHEGLLGLLRVLWENQRSAQVVVRLFNELPVEFLVSSERVANMTAAKLLGLRRGFDSPAREVCDEVTAKLLASGKVSVPRSEAHRLGALDEYSTHLPTGRTPIDILQLHVTPDIQTKLDFLLLEAPETSFHRYAEWLQLALADAGTLRIDDVTAYVRAAPVSYPKGVPKYRILKWLCSIAT